MNDPFEIVGVRPELLERQAPEKENRWYQGVPWLSVIVLLIIAGGWLSIVSIHQNFPDVPPWLLPEELVCVELPPEELPLELDTTLDVTLDATSTSEF